MPARGGIGDRVAGAVVAGFALVMWLVVIPDQVDAVDYGWMRPQTLPGIATAAMGLFGVLLMVAPGSRAIPVDPGSVGRLAALALLVAAVLWAMDRWGFPVVAPVLVAGLVWLLGERRWPWVVGAALLAPAAIWFVVAIVLQRALP